MHSKDVKFVVAQLIPQLITMILNGSKECDIRKPIWYLDSGCSRHMTSVKRITFLSTSVMKKGFPSSYTPEQNGVAERKNRTLIEAARTMLSGSIFYKQYWIEAVATACLHSK
ncbi:retrovirus-related pol polyprotein from transposon TNT 1-94 [Tanacetum coccineum]